MESVSGLQKLTFSNLPQNNMKFKINITKAAIGVTIRKGGGVGNCMVAGSFMLQN
jgi:hypothetical protein